ncbi:MAG: DsbA family protein [Candidatus Thiodiazotropha sp. 6PDIVS]
MPHLYYVHDPMCSWCWAFKPTLSKLLTNLPDSITYSYLLGGLAADSEEPMDLDMQERLKNTWLTIQKKLPQTEFNYNFWSSNVPRRSTYPACRAVITTRLMDAGSEEKIIVAIQQAYYIEARNPSDHSTLIEIAGEIGLEPSRFQNMLNSESIHNKLLEEIEQSRLMGINSFPGLALNIEGSYWPIPIDYHDENSMLEIIHQLLT